MERDVLACVLEDATNIAETGGKAYNLGRMVRLGLNVPRGFVLKTAAFHQFLAANRLEDLILEIQNNGSPDIHSVATTVRELVMKSAVPEEILDCVLEMRRQYL